MRSAIRKKPVRVQFRPTSVTTTREPATSVAAATMNAADEGSPGTASTSPSSSSSTWRTVERRPSCSKGTRARRSSRSVWSRLGTVSTTVVEPAANMPAIRTHDLTCALGTGSS
jgi:hypothetical protein